MADAARGFIGKPITALHLPRNKQLFLNDCSAPIDSQAPGAGAYPDKLYEQIGLQPNNHLG
jgi:hypothetical protein